MNIRQTPEHAKFLRSIGWQIESYESNKRTIYAYIRKIPLLPISLIKIQRVWLDEINWHWLDQITNKHHAFEVLIELDELSIVPPPTHDELTKHGFKPVKEYMLTTKTRILNLDKSETELLNDLKSKTKYNLGLAKRRGLITHIYSGTQVSKNSDLYAQIYKLLKSNAQRIKMLLIPKTWIWNQLNAFGDKVWMITVEKKYQIEAVACFFMSSDTCFYHHNGSTAEGRRDMAPTLALWTGIIKAKEKGFLKFDFDGIYDERIPVHRWDGFTKFKAGFGGDEMYFPLMYKKLRWPY